MKQMSRRPDRTARLSALIVTATLVSLLAACSPAGPAEEEDRSLTIAAGSVAIANWDPAQGGVVFDDPVSNAVYEGLGYWDFPTSTLVPVLAESFDIADDGLSLTVVLRDDVDFVDGTHLNAEGAVKYYEYLLGESSGYVLSGAVAKYEPSFEVTGEYTFVISAVLPIYFPVSFAFLMQTPVLSPVAIDDPELVATEPVGTGPYVIDETVPDVEVRLVRNPDYRDQDAYPYDEIIVKAFADPVAKLNALKSGQVEVADLTIPLGIEAGAAGFTIHEFNNQVAYLSVRDPENSPIEALRDLRVRQAIMHAFDREAIAENVYQGYAEPAVQVYIPGQPEYIEGVDDRYAYDPEKARDLMAEAGYGDGFDVTLTSFPAATGDLEPIIQQSLADIGIRVTFEPAVDGVAFFIQNIDGTRPMGFTAEQIFANSTRLLDENFGGLGQLFIPTEKVIDLLATIRGADPDAAGVAAQDLGEFLLDDLWYLPIVAPSKLWATTADVAIDADPIWGVRLRDFAPAA